MKFVTGAAGDDSLAGGLGIDTADYYFTDPTGSSGSHIGHEFDARARWRLAPQVQTELLYAYFKAGTFLENAGRGGTSNLIFAQFTFSAF